MAGLYPQAYPTALPTLVEFRNAWEWVEDSRLSRSHARVVSIPSPEALLVKAADLTNRELDSWVVQGSVLDSDT